MLFIAAIAVSTEATDYADSFTRTITFSAKSNSIQCVDINIRGDDVVEGEESFLVTFSSENAPDVIVGRNSTVTIEDDDGM